MKSKPNILVFTILMGALILSGCGASTAMATSDATATPTRHELVIEESKLTIEVMATAVPHSTSLPATPTPALGLGKVSGGICFPSEQIPAMKAYFQNTTTNQIVEMAISENQSAYDVDLPAGEYIAYAGLPDFPIVGLYSVNVLCGMGAECADHTPVRFQASPDRVTTGIDICDWYSDSGPPTQPTVSIVPTSGPSGTLVQVTANGFAANTPVSVGLGPVNSEFSGVAQGMTDANGAFNLRVPIQGEVGMDWVLGVSAGDAHAMSTPFRITSSVPTATPTPLATPAPIWGLAKVSGGICFPGGQIPAMKAYFQNTTTNRIVEMTISENQSTYDVNLPAGEYIAYAGLPDFPIVGWYSEYVLCGLGAECIDHTPVRFQALPDRLTIGIDLCDWVSDSGLPAQATVSLLPTSGPSGTLVQVTANDFPAYTPVSVGLGPVNSEFTEVAQGVTDAGGAFNLQVSIQGEAGMDWVVGVSAGDADAISTPFRITSNVPSATPTPYMDMWTALSNPTFAVLLEYPADWQPVPGYGSPETGETRFGAINGFIQIGAMDAASIDDIAAAE
ncbi:MAG: hypothetical protein MUQ30_11445, partial [Anaerolineae bacterium]|nr:hypothetical protein [Anaerolineae bacterium]